MINQRWNLGNIPRVGDPDVAEFAYELFDIARKEKERLGKPADFMANYALYRGAVSKAVAGRKGYSPQEKGRTPVNLYFANIERTVANITARIPVGEVVDMDGTKDDAETIFSNQLKRWWKDSSQQLKTRSSAREMEIYGITIEKPVRDPSTNQPDILITDPFSFFPAPGNWVNIAEEAPYICFAYLNYVSGIESDFKVTDIAVEDTTILLGTAREEIKTMDYSSSNSLGNYADPMTIRRPTVTQLSDKMVERGIIIEVWLRDNSEGSETTQRGVMDEGGNPVLDDLGGEEIEEVTTTKRIYPDGIRKITISRTKDPTVRGGWVVLDDSPNPNINFKHIEQGTDISTTYPWGKLPVYIANSYKDGISVWGFAAAEQVGDLIARINLIVSKLINYVINVMTPPLIVQQHCGITREMIESSIAKAGRLILMPSTPNARIEFMQIPNLPNTFFQVLDLIVKFFDRIYQIEDADRGVGPTGVIAASAIVALQERNQVLMQTKTSAIDNIVEQRSRWAIGIWQNWGVEEDFTIVAGERTPFRGVHYVGRRFNYVVESGSTTPKTSLQLQEMAKWLYEVKAIGQRGLLETLNWPDWKEELGRTAESQLDQAFQVLIAAGLPEQDAIGLRKALQEIAIQNDGPKTAAQGHQPVQPKSLVPPSSNVQSGS
jgi:hypothetical protein